MKKSEYIIKSFLHAAAVLVYVSLVAFIPRYGEAIFGEDPNFLIPVFMLVLLVVSASITGLLVFGRPVLWYVGGRKKEAFFFLFATLGWLIVFLFGVVGVVLLRR